MADTHLSKVTLDASRSLLNAQSLLDSSAASMQAVVTELNALHNALYGLLDTADHADTCGSRLNEVYPCNCWKADLHGILETKEN